MKNRQNLNINSTSSKMSTPVPVKQLCKSKIQSGSIGKWSVKHPCWLVKLFFCFFFKIVLLLQSFDQLGFLEPFLKGKCTVPSLHLEPLRGPPVRREKSLRERMQSLQCSMPVNRPWSLNLSNEILQLFIEGGRKMCKCAVLSEFWDKNLALHADL